MQQFMQRYDLVIGPTTQVLPFDVTQPYVTQINDQQLATYVDWMMSCAYITMTTHPAISLPVGMTATGLPVGMQVVGRFRDDVNLLRMAATIESSIDQPQFRPTLAQ
jgi:amidase